MLAQHYDGLRKGAPINVARKDPANGVNIVGFNGIVQQLRLDRIVRTIQIERGKELVAVTVRKQSDYFRHTPAYPLIQLFGRPYVLENERETETLVDHGAK
jgi:hypothetical protein